MAPSAGRSRGAILSQYYNRTLQLRRRRSTRPALQDFSRAARPSIRGYRIETDSGDGESRPPWAAHAYGRALGLRAIACDPIRCIWPGSLVSSAKRAFLFTTGGFYHAG